jgi:hypothetical protein
MTLDELRELPELVELGLAVRAGLQIERLRQIRLEQDVAAPTHPVEAKPNASARRRASSKRTLRLPASTACHVLLGFIAC